MRTTRKSCSHIMTHVSNNNYVMTFDTRLQIIFYFIFSNILLVDSNNHVHSHALFLLHIKTSKVR